MSKDGGFDRMDVSTSILYDPKFRRLARLHPDLYPAAVVVYISTLAVSWREGERVKAPDAWPPGLPYDKSVPLALKEVRLLDRSLFVPVRQWDEWYAAAAERRANARARWQRQNALRRDREVTGEVTARQPRGNRGDSSVQSEREPSMTKSSSTRAGARGSGLQSLQEVMKRISEG